MAIRTIETKAIISASDKTGSTFAQVAQKLRAMEMQTKTTSARMSSIAARSGAASESRAAGLIAGGKALVAGAAAYGAGRMISQSVEDWADLEMTVTRLGNTGETTDEKIKATIADFRKLGPQMGVSAKQIAEASNLYVAAGVDFDKAIAATPAALKAAKASGAELNDIVSSGVSALNHYGLTVDGLERAFDIMAKGGKLGSFELKDMAKELPGVSARVKALGLSGEQGLAQVAAMLETVMKVAPNGSEGANYINNFLDKITSQDTIKNFKKMGIDLEKELKHGLEVGRNYIDTTLALVEKLTKGDEFKIGQLFNDRQAKLGIKSLLDFKEFYLRTRSELERNSIGTNTRDFNRAMETSRAKLDKLSASWEVVRTRLGEKFGVPALQPVVDSLNDLLEKMDELEAKQKRGEAYANTPGQAKFNRIMNRAAGGGMAGSSQSVFDPSVERAARDKAVRDQEDKVAADIAATEKRIAELKARPVNPFLGKRNDQNMIDRLTGDRDALQARLDQLRQTREAISGLLADAAKVDQALARINGMGINQVPPMGKPTGTLGRGAFPMSVRNWNSVDPIVAHGVRAGESILGSPEWKVSLDPASKAEVNVNIRVDASSQLITAFTESKRVTSAGNISASIGTVGKTGVGSQGD